MLAKSARRYRLSQLHAGSRKWRKKFAGMVVKVANYNIRPQDRTMLSISGPLPKKSLETMVPKFQFQVHIRLFTH
eukprot:TRINITY_DN3082_c0_g1_i1.p1 TRINITY_DN3082_c0_g1~~TRINITY_DN3082_c0_g1_i1.p1  ORF type:complete len:75 (-),score=5.08 TRINITY_DN3082_c0_g1_i1:69-293(-)